MEIKRSLLKVARLLAITAAGTGGAQTAAEAAVPPATQGVQRNAAAVTNADPVFELMRLTDGSFSAAAVENAIRSMYVDPTPAQVQMIPSLLSGLSSLGAPRDVIDRSKVVLREVVSNAASISEAIREDLLAEFSSDQVEFKLAQAQPNRNQQPNRRDRREVGQVPAPAS